jgi:hypothetical protein
MGTADRGDPYFPSADFPGRSNQAFAKDEPTESPLRIKFRYCLGNWSDLMADLWSDIKHSLHMEEVVDI